MGKIEIQHLTFDYDGTRIFDNVDIVLDDSWKLALIGRNGRGKTTLLKLLQNKLEFQGTITHQLDLLYFPQEIKEKEQLTLYALQEIAEFEEWELMRELNALKVDLNVLYQPFKTLSGGEATKVLLALLFIDEFHFPLIDEPTNHLDIEGRKTVADYLKAKRQGFILVSHDRDFVDSVVDHVISIEKTQLRLYQGNFSVYEMQKELRDNYNLIQNSKLKKEIIRLKQSAADKAEFSRSREKDKYGSPKVKGSRGNIDTGFIGARSARMMKKSKNIEHRLQKEVEVKEGLLKDIEQVDTLEMKMAKTHHTRLLTVENLTLSYGNMPLFQPITFELKKGNRIALIGENGSGKSSVIQAILGKFPAQMNGSITQAENLKISLVRQNYADNTGTLKEFAAREEIEYELLLNNLKKLGIKRSVFNTPIELMSMGEQKKVELAKSLSEKADVFIWDEPLNYLDVFNHEQIKTVILKFEPTLLIVEHDKRFLKEIALQVIALKKPQKT
ncbi:MAG: ABC-F type ribosomal protection protein [Streptococcaceae bacterium]|nr:ABC-F type ribosomal protection protein [Streptococcaceae bacterium]